MTDQPTPTSSLEEARERVRLSHNYACDTLYPMPPSPLSECNCGAYQSLLDFEAAARAEVIREVEAAIREKLGVTSRALAVVRALSQGGK